MQDTSARPRLLLVRGLVVLLAFVFASVTLLHEGAHADAEHLAQQLAVVAVDLGPDDCEQESGPDAKGEHCAAVTLCKICVPVADTTAPRYGASIRHSWRSSSFTALRAGPHRKPPKLIVRA